MKSIILSFLLFMAAISAVFAQTEKGKFLISGSSDLSFVSSKMKFQNTGSQLYDFDNDEFSFETGAGYFLADNFSVGIGMGFESSKQSSKEVSNTSKSFYFGPVVRYYIGKTKLRPYLDASLLLGNQKETTRVKGIVGYIDSDYKVFGGELGAGAAFFINDYLSLDLKAGYVFASLTNKDDSGIDLETDGFGLQLGFSIFF